MKMGINNFSAKDVINHLEEKELEKIFKYFGEEKESKRIAHNIVEDRKSQRNNNRRTGKNYRIIKKKKKL